MSIKDNFQTKTVRNEITELERKDYCALGSKKHSIWKIQNQYKG